MLTGIAAEKADCSSALKTTLAGDLNEQLVLGRRMGWMDSGTRWMEGTGVVGVDG